METKKLKVRVTERTTKEGRKFNAYSTFSKNGRRTELKFTKGVKDVPTEDCYIEVAKTDMNLNTSGEYPVVWVKNVIAIEEIAEVIAEKNSQAIDDYFG